MSYFHTFLGKHFLAVSHSLNKSPSPLFFSDLTNYKMNTTISAVASKYNSVMYLPITVNMSLCGAAYLED